LRPIGRVADLFLDLAAPDLAYPWGARASASPYDPAPLMKHFQINQEQAR
jgi:hypothetical protein